MQAAGFSADASPSASGMQAKTHIETTAAAETGGITSHKDEWSMPEQLTPHAVSKLVQRATTTSRPSLHSTKLLKPLPQR